MSTATECEACNAEPACVYVTVTTLDGEVIERAALCCHGCASMDAERMAVDAVRYLERKRVGLAR